MSDDFKLILDAISYVRGRVDDSAKELSRVNLSIKGLHNEHERMNSTLEDHVEGVKQNRTRVEAVEVGLKSLKDRLKNEEDLKLAIKKDRQKVKERRMTRITYWSKRVTLWTGIVTLIGALIGVIAKLTGIV
jgi:septal ring factor EnvC (AmiA/AmiB activator)